MATRRWQPLALASVVTAMLAGAVVLRAATSGDGGQQALAATPTSAPTAIAGASSTLPPQPVLTEVTPVLVKRAFAAGEDVSLSHGVGFLSAADGSLETWSHADGTKNSFGIVATPDGALLVYYSDAAGEPPWVVERATGRTWRMGANISPMPLMAHGTTMVVSIRSARGVQPAIIDVATETVTTLAPSAADARQEGLTSPEGRRVAAILGDRLLLVELATGRVTELATGILTASAGLYPLAGALGFALTPDAPGSARRWFSWDGTEVDHALGPESVAPGGRYAAVAWSPGLIKGGGMGALPAIGAITVSERQSGRPVTQLLGAQTLAVPDEGWSPTGDALVIQVPDGYRYMSVAGQTLATLPDSIHVLNPRPSPTLPGLLGTNRGTIVNTVRNTATAPKYAELPFRARWSTKPGELIVELSSPGKGRDWPIDVMPFEVRTQGIQGEPKVAIRASGPPCVSVRAEPRAQAAEVECAADGLKGSVTAIDDPTVDPKAPADPPRKYSGVRDASEVTWLHLELDSGKQGWVDADHLRWAP